MSRKGKDIFSQNFKCLVELCKMSCRENSPFCFPLCKKTEKHLFIFGSWNSSRLSTPLFTQSSLSDWMSFSDWGNLASLPQTILLTQLFHFLTFSFSPSESITRPISPVHFLLFSYLLPVCHSMLGPVGLSPSCLHPCGCLFVLLFISLLIFLSASSGHKCLRHCTRVLDTQVVISPSQDQVHSEVRG